MGDLRVIPGIIVPEIVARRVWECAVVLREEYVDRLGLEQHALVVAADRGGPETIGWEYAGALFRLYSEVVVVRV